MSTTVTTTAQLPADLREAFDGFVADAVGDFRPTPLARLVAAHLVLFAELRRRGASWAQIADLLAAGGVVGSNGASTGGVVRATYTRAAADAARRKRAGHNGTKRNEGNRNAAKRDVTQRNAAGRDETKAGKASDDASTAEPRMQGEAVPTRPGTTRDSAARNQTGKNKSDPPDHGIADLFRRAAFFHDPANRR